MPGSGIEASRTRLFRRSIALPTADAPQREGEDLLGKEIGSLYMWPGAVL